MAAAAARPGDPDEELLLQRVRDGDVDAFDELYRSHAAAAGRLATVLVGAERADDLVAESFARVLDQLRRGRGPSSSFRSYLHSTIRNRHRDLLRSDREQAASDQPWLLDELVPSAEELAEGIDDNGAIAALTSLPSAWQRALWYVEVEGRKPGEVAELLGTNAPAVSSLVYRAREGLRRAYLDNVGGPLPTDPACRWTRERLSQFVRGDLGNRAALKLQSHLADCHACSRAHEEMDELNRRLGALLVPIVLVAGGRLLDDAAPTPVATDVSAPTGTGDGRPRRPRETGGDRLAGELAARAAGQSAQQAAAAAATGAVSTGMVVAAATIAAAVVAAGATTWALTSGPGEGSGPGGAPAATSAPATAPTHPPAVDGPATSSEPRLGSRADPVADQDPAPSPSGPYATPTVPSPAPTERRGPSDPTHPPLEAVRPVAPLANPVDGCGQVGSLTLPATEGVRYDRVVGDGREGRWVVVATARDGYVLADGAQRRFSGDLGHAYDCPALRTVTAAPDGSPVGAWDVTVTPAVAGPGPAVVQVVYEFAAGVLVRSRSGAGWTCREPSGGEVGHGPEYYFPAPSPPLTCTFDYDGSQPPGPVRLNVLAVDAAFQAVEPAGQVVLRVGGDVTDTASFTG